MSQVPSYYCPRCERYVPASETSRYRRGHVAGDRRTLNGFKHVGCGEIVTIAMIDLSECVCDLEEVEGAVHYASSPDRPDDRAAYAVELFNPDLEAFSRGEGTWRVTRNDYTPRAPWRRVVVAEGTRIAMHAALRLFLGRAP